MIPQAGERVLGRYRRGGPIKQHGRQFEIESL
jgi:hypothetical protein